jgi:hypothetical protein
MARRVAKKRVTKKKVAKKTGAGTSLFPSRITIEWPDGTKEVLAFSCPRFSAKGNMNAHAGDKLHRNGNILRVNCNVTQSRG